MSDRLKQALEGLLMAAAGGAIGALAEQLGHGVHDPKDLKTAAVTGAVIALAAWFRQSPVQPKA